MQQIPCKYNEKQWITTSPHISQSARNADRVERRFATGLGQEKRTRKAGCKPALRPKEHEIWVLAGKRTTFIWESPGSVLINLANQVSFRHSNTFVHAAEGQRTFSDVKHECVAGCGRTMSRGPKEYLLLRYGVASLAPFARFHGSPTWRIGICRVFAVEQIFEFKSKNQSFCSQEMSILSSEGKTNMKTLARASQKMVRARYVLDDERWTAVVHRDPKADGKFYFSVKTTGVYCRPSCAARLARRENVRFHLSCQEAERAGFRACKRCQPNGPSLADQYVAMVAAACRAIKTAEEMPGLDALAKAAGMSRFHFHRVFKKITGLTPKDYAMAHRAERIRAELGKPSTVTEAIYGAGFNSNSRFYAESWQALGMPPKKFRDGGIGMAIRFALGECSLGSILVASSERGVCAISLGDDPNKLVKEFQDRFSKALLIGGDKTFERVVARVIGFVEAPQLGLSLPLDVRGTAFQRRVWKALREIPAGATASYTEIAKRIGAPKAIRAVAGACAANVIAVAIPCHRVLRNDGSLSGYRWGVERKRSLLEKETAMNRPAR